MNACFGRSAASLAGAAARLLGWRPADFWDCTPAELAQALSGPDEDVPTVERAMLDQLKQRFPDN